MTEREKIVAYLRREAADVVGRLCGPEGEFHAIELAEMDADLIENIANRIERGDHLKRPEPTIPFEQWRDKPSVGH